MSLLVKASLGRQSGNKKSVMQVVAREGIVPSNRTV